jgi:nicotinamide mononucleotide transporter
MKVFLLALAILSSVAVMAASFLHRGPFAPTEALGFVTGAWCVWLAVRENLWNWPINIVSSFFYAVLFWHTGLYADMGQQVVNAVLCAFGWYWWLHGNQAKRHLAVTQTSHGTGTALFFLVIAGTVGLTAYLRTIHDTAPFLDALTTILSLVAMYQTSKKLIENWYVWLLADTIYVGLYIYKHLYLTAGLNSLYVVLCFIGLQEWRRSQKAAETSQPLPIGLAHD